MFPAVVAIQKNPQRIAGLGDSGDSVLYSSTLVIKVQIHLPFPFPAALMQATAAP